MANEPAKSDWDTQRQLLGGLAEPNLSDALSKFSPKPSPQTPQAAAAMSGAVPDDNVLISPDGRLVIVGVTHGSAPTVSDKLRSRIHQTGTTQGFYYEGNGDDRAHVQKTFGEVPYKGSFDNMVNVPEGGRSNFLYTMFSNPPEQMNKMVDTLSRSGGTILDTLHANRDSVSHEAVRGQLSREDIAHFLHNTGFGDDALKPATRENLQSLMQRGEAQMWPDNWQEFPNPAGKVAHAAESARLRSVTERGSGVYFMGADNLPLLQKIDPRLSSAVTGKKS